MGNATNRPMFIYRWLSRVSIADRVVFVIAAAGRNLDPGAAGVRAEMRRGVDQLVAVVVPVQLQVAADAAGEGGAGSHDTRPPPEAVVDVGVLRHRGRPPLILDRVDQVAMVLVFPYGLLSFIGACP